MADEKALKELLADVPETLLAEALAERVTTQPNPTVEITEVVRAVAHVSQTYSGPIPPPQMLAEYEAVQPGFADRIISMAEKEQANRHLLENKAVDGAIKKDARGQHYALMTSFGVLGGGSLLIYTGHDWAGVALCASALTGLAYIFVSGNRKKENIPE